MNKHEKQKKSVCVCIVENRSNIVIKYASHLRKNIDLLIRSKYI